MTRRAAAVPIADDAPHILVVDDDRRMRELLARFLGEHGYRVTTRRAPREARAKVEALVFDLIMLDVMMPGETGFDFASAVPRRRPTCPILMLTARVEAERPHPRARDRRRRLSRRSPSSRASCCCASATSSSARRRAARPSRRAELVRFGPFVFRCRPRRAAAATSETIRITEREREILRDPRRAAPGETVAALRRSSARRRRRERAHRRRADQPAAPQDRDATRPTRSTSRPCAASATAWRRRP